MRLSNSRVFTSSATAALTAALGFYGLPANAQDTGDGYENEIEEVIVTASRREESLQDVAIATAVVDVGELIDAGFSSLTDVLAFVPGVSVADNGASIFSEVFVRGVNATGAAGVATYFDEIPVGSSSVYGIGTAPLDGTLMDIQSMNVLKGPQGTLYGASAMGGLIKYETRKPSLSDWSGSMSADLSSTSGSPGLNQIYTLKANGPVVKDSIGLSFTAFYNDQAGYIENVVLDEDGYDAYEFYGGSASLFWLVNDKLDLSLQALYQRSDQTGSSTIQANGGDDIILPGLSAGEPWFGRYKTGAEDTEPNEFEQWVTGFTLNYDLDWATFTSVTSYQELSLYSTADLTIPFASFADMFYPESAPHTSAILVNDSGDEKFTQEFRLTSSSNQSFEWILGAFYTIEDTFQTQELLLTPPSELYYFNAPSTYEEYALFGTGTYYVTPDFDISAGLRYTDYSNDIKTTSRGPLASPNPLSEFSDKVTNFLLNARYRPSENTSVYGRVASGYRPGAANITPLDPVTGEPLALPAMQPDELVSYEIGFKGAAADGRLFYDLSAFYIDWQDYQVFIFLNGVSAGANAGKAISKGAEASLTYAATDQLTFTGTVSYTNAELGEDEPNLGGVKGEQLPGTPEWQAVFDVNYEFNVASLPAYAGLSWRYKDEMSITFDGYTDDSGVFWPPFGPNLILDSYSVFDLRAGFTVDAFDFNFYVTNLTDKWAYANFSSTFFAASVGTPIRPRTYGAQIRWNFK